MRLVDHQARNAHVGEFAPEVAIEPHRRFHRAAHVGFRAVVGQKSADGVHQSLALLRRNLHRWADGRVHTGAFVGAFIGGSG